MNSSAFIRGKRNGIDETHLRHSKTLKFYAQTFFWPLNFLLYIRLFAVITVKVWLDIHKDMFLIYILVAKQQL